MVHKNLLKLGATLSVATLGVVATSAVHADTVYTVKEGDTLSSISSKYAHKADVNAIAKKNNIDDVNMIHVGQKLVIKNNGTIQLATKKTAKPKVAKKAPKAKLENLDYTPATSGYHSNLSAADQAAKDWIAYHESRGIYTVQNGQYYGRYQLSLSYLNGDLSPENQERVADQYVASRYGSWTAAQQFWMANGWY